MALELAKYGCAATISGALTRMTIPLRENRGETVEESDMEAGGPQHIAPICAWLAGEDPPASRRNFPRCSRRYRHHAAAARYQAVKSEGVWGVEELDSLVPQLMEAKKANMAAADASAKPTVS